MNRRKNRSVKKRVSVILTGILLALLLLSIAPAALDTVVAYMFKKSAEVTNVLEAANVTIEVEETFTNNVKENVHIRNSGNTPVYIRVAIVEYWMKDGVYVAKPEGVTPNKDIADGDWMKIGELYYYINRVEVNGETTDLIRKATTDLPEGYTYHMDIHAEAIQALPEKAVKEAWGLYVDKNGQLTQTPPTA